MRPPKSEAELRQRRVFFAALAASAAEADRGGGDDLELSVNSVFHVRPEALSNPNRVIESENFEDAAWLEVASPTILGGQEDPDGGNTAILLTATNNATRIEQDVVGFQASQYDTSSVWIKAGPSHNGTSVFRLQIDDGPTVHGDDQIPTAEWKRYPLTKLLDAAATRHRYRIYPDAATASQSIYVAFAQVEAGQKMTTYRANEAIAGGYLALWDNIASANDLKAQSDFVGYLVEADFFDEHAAARLDHLTSLMWLTPTELDLGIAGCDIWVVMNNTPPASPIYCNGSTFRITLSRTNNVIQVFSGGVNRTISMDSAWADGVALYRVFRTAAGDWHCEVNGQDKTLAVPVNNADQVKVQRPFQLSAGNMAQHGLESVIYDENLLADDEIRANRYFRFRYPSLAVSG